MSKGILYHNINSYKRRNFKTYEKWQCAAYYIVCEQLPLEYNEEITRLYGFI